MPVNPVLSAGSTLVHRGTHANKATDLATSAGGSGSTLKHNSRTLDGKTTPGIVFHAPSRKSRLS